VTLDSTVQTVYNNADTVSWKLVTTSMEHVTYALITTLVQSVTKVRSRNFILNPFSLFLFLFMPKGITSTITSAAATTIRTTTPIDAFSDTACLTLTLNFRTIGQPTESYFPPESSKRSRTHKAISH
jgi:hypothetical protein